MQKVKYFSKNTPPRPTVRNKQEKLEGKGEASFDTPFMIQNYAENIKKIMGAL